MNVAEEKAHAQPVKPHGVGGPCFIQAKIKPLPIEEREHVVKKRIVIREIHHGSHGNHQHMRLKCFVVLNQLKFPLRGAIPCISFRRRFERLQPHHDFRRIRCCFGCFSRFRRCQPLYHHAHQNIPVLPACRSAAASYYSYGSDDQPKFLRGTDHSH